MNKPAFAPPPPPKGLSREACAWWRKLQANYDLDDEGGKLLLQSALEAFDEVKKAQKIVEQQGMTVRDRFGQHKPHPLLTTIRDSRSAFIMALKALNLGVEALEERPGRPAGSGKGG